jgi:hypothetical protein
MPYNMRTPAGAGPGAAHTYPISRCFALTVLAALVILAILRHLFGSVSVQVGTK